MLSDTSNKSSLDWQESTKGRSCTETLSRKHLKRDNILISDEKSVKICDFGAAKFITETTKYCTPYVVSQYYRAPELLCGFRKYTNKIDIFGRCLTSVRLHLGRDDFQRADFQRSNWVAADIRNYGTNGHAEAELHWKILQLSESKRLFQTTERNKRKRHAKHLLPKVWRENKIGWRGRSVKRTNYWEICFRLCRSAVN